MPLFLRLVPYGCTRHTLPTAERFSAIVVLRRIASGSLPKLNTCYVYPGPDFGPSNVIPSCAIALMAAASPAIDNVCR